MGRAAAGADRLPLELSAGTAGQSDRQLAAVRLYGWEVRMKIGILGAGNVGTALGTSWAHRKHEVKFGVRDSQSPENSIPAVSMADAVHFAEVVVLALPWPAAHDLVLALDL